MTKILLVEDDKNLREIYGVRLSAEGYQVISTGNGEEALASAVGEKPDLIVSDVMMPKISGFEMLYLLKGNDATKNIPIIMLTALSSETQRDRGDNLGADRYLVKSQVGLEDIVRTVHEVLAEYGIEKPADGLSASAPLDTTMPVASQTAPESSLITPEPIINNPSILGTNFASAVDAASTPFDIDNDTSSDNDSNNNSDVNVPPANVDGDATDLNNGATSASSVQQSQTVKQAEAPMSQTASVAVTNQVPMKPAAYQSAYNPNVATHPAMASNNAAPQMPDTPMRVPMPIENGQNNMGNADQTVSKPVVNVPQAQLQPQPQIQVQQPTSSEPQGSQMAQSAQITQPAQNNTSVNTAPNMATMPNAQVNQVPSMPNQGTSQPVGLGGERNIAPVERRTPRIDIDSLLNGVA